MSDRPPKAFYDSEDDMVMIGSQYDTDDFMWFLAEDIQAVVTSLLQAHSDYVDEQKRRSEGAKD
jgi:hypothetical protein